MTLDSLREVACNYCRGTAMDLLKKGKVMEAVTEINHCPDYDRAINREEFIEAVHKSKKSFNSP